MTTPRGWFRRILLTIPALVVIGAATYGFRHLGTYFDAEEPLQKADVIVVLAGSLVERPLEAYDLWRQGYAPRIFVTRALVDDAYLELLKRGIRLPLDADLAHQALRELGVPETAIIKPDRFHDNTADEARTFRVYAVRNGWKRAIVVSSKYHLRRVGLAYRRELAGTDIEVVLHGSRYDRSDPPNWWRYRADIRWLLSEGPKLVAYRLGLGAD